MILGSFEKAARDLGRERKIAVNHPVNHVVKILKPAGSTRFMAPDLDLKFLLRMSPKSLYFYMFYKKLWHYIGIPHKALISTKMTSLSMTQTLSNIPFDSSDHGLSDKH